MKTDVPRYVYTPGQDRVPPRRTFNPDFVALWKPYLDEGMSAKHVAEIFSTNEKMIHKYYPGRGWTHKQVVTHALVEKRAKSIV